MRTALFFLLLCTALGSCQSSDDIGRDADGSLVLGGVETTEVIERGVVPGARTLVLTGFSGQIMLSGANTAQASLRFTKRGRGDDNDAARKALGDIRIDEAGDDRAYRYTISSGNESRTSVDVAGTVPNGTPLEIRLASGTVVVREVVGPLVIEVQNGQVRVAAAASNVSAEAQNGDVLVSMARVPENATLNLSTQNGRLALGLPQDAGVRIEATSAVGTIQATGLDFRSQRLEPKGAGATFNATLGSGAARATLATQNGVVEIRPADQLTVISATPPDTSRPVAAPRTPPASN